MYESPLKLVTSDQIIQHLTEKTESYILQSVAKVGVIVDKNELVKALAYDRNEYERGFNDGMRIAETVINQLRGVINDQDIKIQRLIHKEVI